MNQEPNTGAGFNRRDFIKGGSAATLLSMMGGVQLFAQSNEVSLADKVIGPKLKVGIIGLGPWGRELLTTLSRNPLVEVAAICDNYAAMLRRSAKAAPGAVQTDDYKTILANKDISAVVVATPTHQHKDIVLDAIKAEKHVYCEAPLAHTIADAKAIAKAAAEAKQLVFQAGLQLRADPLRHFLLPFIRSGALGQISMARAQWHKKTSWRVSSPSAEREKDLNWRLDKDLSTGLVGELSIHQLDQAMWFIDARPETVTGFGTIALWKDGREVPDTVHAVMRFPSGACLNYDATLTNSFDASYEMFYGSDAAIMLRDASDLRGATGWLFKEVDSPLFGWEVYAKKDVFYRETGIVLKPGASKSTSEQQTEDELFRATPLYKALDNFARNASDVNARAEDLKESLGEVDPEELAKVQRRPSANYAEGYQATVLAIKTNEAILKRERIDLKPSDYELS